jgi:hypothetical protein
MGTFLAVWVVAVFVAVPFVFWAYTRRSERRVSELSSLATPEQSFVGGLRWTRRQGFGGANATMPLVRLSFFDWGVRLSPSARFFRPFVPVIEVRFGEVESASAGTGPVMRSGCVQIHAPRSDFRSAFWTSQVEAVLDAFQAHGILVDRNPTPIGMFRWMDQ